MRRSRKPSDWRIKMASFLLDTCALIWATSDPKQLSKKAHLAISDDANRIFVSHATLWEMSIKITVGKLHVAKGFFEQLEDLGYEMLPIKEAHFSIYRKLPLIHRDPFDRLLVAQSISEEIPLVTCDRETAKYPIEMLW